VDRAGQALRAGLPVLVRRERRLRHRIRVGLGYLFSARFALALMSTVWMVPFLMFFDVTTMVAAVPLAAATTAATTAAMSADFIFLNPSLSPLATGVSTVLPSVACHYEDWHQKSGYSGGIGGGYCVAPFCQTVRT
jgi:hypothetical protein